MLLRGSKKTSKMEPKVVSGRGFSDFGQSLISCNTTRVLLDFHGSRVAQGDQKTIKKRFKKKTSKKPAQNRVFYKKIWKWSPKWTPIWTTNSPPIPPRGVIIPTWGPRAPKRSPRVTKGCRKTSKRSKMEPKGYQNHEKKQKYWQTLCLVCLQSSTKKGTVAGLPQASGYNYIWHLRGDPKQRF